jgi:uncharacterized protein (DUF58 family)
MSKKARQISLKARKQVFGSLSGSNLSRFQGEGFEFAELREYVFGDDVRKIDWKTTAKAGKPYIKIYYEERELNVVVSTLLSGSTFFGVSKPMYEYMIETLAILGYSAVKNRDLFSHILYADKMYRRTKPSKKVYAVNKEIEEVLKFEVLGKPANTKGWISDLNKYVKKKSLLIMVGDFIGDYNLSILAKKHDLILIIVRDYFIEHLKPMGEITLIDPAYLDSFRGNVDEETIKVYKESLIANDKKLYKHIREIGARVAKIYTNQEPYIQLLKRLK